MPWKAISALDMRPNAPRGTVYLIHFDKPVKHARHYIGFTELPLEQRITEHREGKGARLCAVAVALGVELQLVRFWPDATRHLERRLKNRGGAKTICPICSPDTVK